jgi:hypothetical protein
MASHLIIYTHSQLAHTAPENKRAGSGRLRRNNYFFSILILTIFGLDNGEYLKPS